jgi:hypothetical protein
MDNDTKPLVSDLSNHLKETRTQFPAWMKVSAVAAASALAGGLAAAWFYRKTVTHLRNAESELENSNFRIHTRGTDDEF